MGKIGCICGSVIVDQTDYLPNKGYLVPDAHQDVLMEAVYDYIRGLREATEAGQRDVWIKEHFSIPPDSGESDENILFDLISKQQWAVTQLVYECSNCGRILIQNGKENQYKFFKPESEESQGILNGKKLNPR